MRISVMTKALGTLAALLLAGLPAGAGPAAPQVDLAFDRPASPGRNSGTATGITVVGGTPCPGRDGGGLRLDGRSGVRWTGPGPGAPRTGIGVSLWARFDRTDVSMNIASREKEFLLRIDPPSEGGRLSWFVNAGGSMEPRLRVAMPPAGRWVHLAAAWDGQTATLWINDRKAAISRPGVLAPTTNPTLVGLPSTFGPTGILGAIDSVRVLDRPMADGEALGAYFGLASLRGGTRRDPRFDMAGDARSWQVRRGSGSTASLRATSDSLLVRPGLDLDCDRLSTLSLRLAATAGTHARVALLTTTGVASVQLPLVADGAVHSYVADLASDPGWVGRCTAIAVSPTDAPATVRLADLRLGNQPLAAPELRVQDLVAEPPILRANRSFELVATLRNAGSASRPGSARPALPAGARVEGGPVRAVPALAYDATATVRWRVTLPQPGRVAVAVTATAPGATACTGRAKLDLTPPVPVTRPAYIPDPKPLDTGKYWVGAHYCPLWKQGSRSNGWDFIEPYPDRKPALGWYDEGDPEVTDWDIKWALEHGIQYFVYCWYRQGQGVPVRQFLGHAIHEGLFHARFRNRFHFAIMWENGIRGTAGVSDQKDLLTNLLPFWIENYFKDPQYLRLGGKPMLFIYRPEYLVADLGGIPQARAAIAAMRQSCEVAGLGGLVVLGENRDADPAMLRLMKDIGLDAAFPYIWPVGGTPTDEQAIAAQEQAWANWRKADVLPTISVASMGWDSRPWYFADSQFWLQPRSYEKLLRSMRREMDKRPAGDIGGQMLLLDNWNEFGEGHFIQPHRLQGFGYLDAVRNAFASKPAPHQDLVPQDIGRGPYEKLYTAYKRDREQLAQRSAHPLGKPAGIEAWWDFEGSGTPNTVRDASGHGLSGRPADASLVPGRSGLALDCRGGSVTVPGGPSRFGWRGFSIEAWIRVDRPDQDDRWIANAIYNDGSRGFRFGLYQGSLTFALPQTPWSHHLRCEAPLPVGVWTHVAGTYDGRTMRAWVNGKLAGTMARVGPVRATTGHLTIGSYDRDHPAYFVGLVDDLKLYSRPRSAAELRAHAAPAAAVRPVRVLVLSGQNNHDWHTTTPRLKAILAGTGRFTVTVAEHPESLSAADLARVDVIVSNWNAFGDFPVKEWQPAARTAILDAVRRGVGHISVHAGGSSFYNWPEYQQMAGHAWRNGVTGHGAIHPFAVQVTDPAHPITHGMRFYATRDELWHRTQFAAGMQPIATAYSEAATGGSGADEPIALVGAYGKGRTFSLVLGHDADAMETALFRGLLARGAEWCGTGAVTLPAPSAELTEVQLSAALEAMRTWKPADRKEPMWLLEAHVGAVAGTPAAVRAAGLLGLLASDRSACLEARRFACKQLALIGGAQDVAGLELLIRDKEIGPSAVQALERIPAPEAAEALYRSLRNPYHDQWVAVLSALAAKRDDRVVPILVSFAPDAKKAEHMVGLEGLGRIGTPAAMKGLLSLERIMGATDSLYSIRPDPPMWARSVVQCAYRLYADGDIKNAELGFSRVCATRLSITSRAAAYAGLIRCRPVRAAAMVVAGLKGRDPALRSGAIQAIRYEADGSCLRAALKALPTLPGQAQEAVIALLGEPRLPNDVTGQLPLSNDLKQVIGDDGPRGARLPDAEAALIAVLASNSPAVRIAAAGALGALGSAASVPALVRAAPGSPAMGAAVATALQSLPGAGVDAALAAQLAATSGGTRTVVIRALAARSARSSVPALLGLAESSSADRIEAVNAVGALGRLDCCPRLLALLRASGDDQREAISAALASILSRAGTVKPVLDAWPGAGSPVRACLAGILGAVGRPQGLPILRASMRSPDGLVRPAALKALCEWPDAAPMDDLLALATADTDAKQNVAALRAIARMAPLATNRPPDEVVSVLKRAFRAANRTEERVQLISALGGVAALSAMQEAASHMADPELTEPAALAALQACEQVWRRSPDEAAALVVQLEGSTLPAVRERAARLQIKIGQAENLAIGATATSVGGPHADGASSGPAATVDGDPATYWDEDDNQPLYALRVKLQEAAVVSTIRIEGYQQEMYAPRDFQVLCDGKVAVTVENARYASNWFTLSFAPVKCTTVELRITGYWGNSPGIREFEIYSKPRSRP